jgi:hypothetical protein
MHFWQTNFKKRVSIDRFVWKYLFNKHRYAFDIFFFRTAGIKLGFVTQTHIVIFRSGAGTYNRYACVRDYSVMFFLFSWSIFNSKFKVTNLFNFFFSLSESSVLIMSISLFSYVWRTHSISHFPSLFIFNLPCGVSWNLYDLWNFTKQPHSPTEKIQSDQSIGSSVQIKYYFSEKIFYKLQGAG